MHVSKVEDGRRPLQKTCEYLDEIRNDARLTIPAPRHDTGLAADIKILDSTLILEGILSTLITSQAMKQRYKNIRI